MTAIKQKLRDFVIDNFLFGQQSDMVADDQSFLKNGIIDSTGVLELINFVEVQYGITAEDEELVPENLDSIQNLVQFIERKKREKLSS